MKTILGVLILALLGAGVHAAQPSDMHDETTAAADTPLEHECDCLTSEACEEMETMATEPALTLCDSGDDWFTIEHDPFGRLQGADIEGTAEQMLEVASGIENKVNVSHKRVALRWDGETAYLYSPRNSMSETPVARARITPLAAIIRQVVAAARDRPPEAPLGDWDSA